jgi:CBS domain-containing protein
MIKFERFLDSSKPVSEIADTPVVSCTEDERIRNAIAMILNGFSRIMVLDRGEIRGFLTSLDVLDFLGGGPKYQLYVRYSKGLDLPVDRIMNTDWDSLEKKHSVGDALRIFQKHGRDFHPIVHKNRFSGVLSEMDFLRHLNQPLGFRTEEVMDRKPIIAKGHYSIPDVAKMLCRGEFRFLPVVKEGFLLGVITPYDIISYMNRGPGLNNLRKAKSESTAAMNRDPLTIGPKDDLHEAVNLMNRKRISSVPLTDEGEMLGLITRRDVIDILS